MSDNATYGVAFDLDGTLFDSQSVSKMALEEGFEAFWNEIGEDGPIPAWEDSKVKIGLPTYEFFPALLPDSHKGLWRSLHRHVGKCERDRLETGKGLTQGGVHETMDSLKRSGYWLGCLSNASRGYFDAVLDGCNLRSYFDALVFLGESPGLGKSEVLVKWARVLGGKERLIYVGDRSADIESAHRAGIKAVGVTFGYGSREELVGAEAVIDKMQDLLPVVEILLKAIS
jgi:phosphoglycolate phosphatase